MYRVVQVASCPGRRPAACGRRRMLGRGLFFASCWVAVSHVCSKSGRAVVKRHTEGFVSGVEEEEWKGRAPGGSQRWTGGATATSVLDRDPHRESRPKRPKHGIRPDRPLEAVLAGAGRANAQAEFHIRYRDRSRQAPGTHHSTGGGSGSGNGRSTSTGRTYIRGRNNNNNKHQHVKCGIAPSSAVRPLSKVGCIQRRGRARFHWRQPAQAGRLAGRPLTCCPACMPWLLGLARAWWDVWRDVVDVVAAGVLQCN